MKLLFWSYNDPELHQAWSTHLSEFDFVEIREGDILSEPVDVLVSPANSFGFMDGGIDLHYRNFFGKELEQRVKDEIIKYHYGELMIGAKCTIPIMHSDFQWLLVVPTMRTPTILRPSDPNIYYAAKAIARFAIGHQKEEHDIKISVPGLGTGVGKMPPDICAQHVKLAIQRTMEPWYPESFSDAKLPGDTRRSMHDYIPSF